MVTKDIVKFEIDQLGDEYVEMVYKVIKALEMPIIAFERREETFRVAEQTDWEAFVDRYAGCLSAAPIERGAQGVYETREELA